MPRSVRLIIPLQILTLLVAIALVGLINVGTSAPVLPNSVTGSLPQARTASAVSPDTLAAAPRPHVRHRTTTKHHTHAVRRHVRHLRTRHAVARRHVRRTSPPASVVSPLTAQQRMDRSVARIPGYPQGGATWVLAAKDGYWGTADWYHNVIYISPAVPANRIYDVVAHEWSHLLSVKVYGGDVNAATAGMNKFFGGTGVAGSERAADCMARRLGATWTHYTPCTDSSWQAGAAQLLAGHQL